jgi:outer membrane immunogenic protein
MKRILLAGTFALAAASPTLAADLPQAPPPLPQAPAAYVPAPLPVYDWAGVYVGINGGYAFGNSNWSATPGFGSGVLGSGNFNTSGGLVGGTVGANFQSGQFVFGLEADLDWTDIQGSTTASDCTAAAAPAATGTCQTSNDWLGTVRGRVGYAFDRVLVYGTAGGAFGDVKSSFTAPGVATISTDSTEWGWTAGLGVEVGITPNITAKVEYLYVDLSSGALSCPAATCGGAVVSVPVSFDASLVRAGLNFKFNPF